MGFLDIALDNCKVFCWLNFDVLYAFRTIY